MMISMTATSQAAELDLHPSVEIFVPASPGIAAEGKN